MAATGTHLLHLFCAHLMCIPRLHAFYNVWTQWLQLMDFKQTLFAVLKRCFGGSPENSSFYKTPVHVFSHYVCVLDCLFFGQCMNTSIALGELFPIMCFETNPTADCWLPTLYNIKKYCPKTQNKQITRKYVGKCWNRPVEMLKCCPSAVRHLLPRALTWASS